MGEEGGVGVRLSQLLGGEKGKACYHLVLRLCYCLVESISDEHASKYGTPDQDMGIDEDSDEKMIYAKSLLSRAIQKIIRS